MAVDPATPLSPPTPQPQRAAAPAAAQAAPQDARRPWVRPAFEAVSAAPEVTGYFARDED